MYKRQAEDRQVPFFFFKQKTAYEIGVRLVGSEMCIRDRSEPRHWMVFGQLVMPVQCCAEARVSTSMHGGEGASAQHCTSMTNWPNTIQCLARLR